MTDRTLRAQTAGDFDLNIERVLDGWEITHGDYAVYVGASSRDIRLTSTLHV